MGAVWAVLYSMAGDMNPPPIVFPPPIPSSGVTLFGADRAVAMRNETRDGNTVLLGVTTQ